MKKLPSTDELKKTTTKKEIARKMNIHVNTLNRRLSKVGVVVPRGVIFPRQLAEIYEKLGWQE